jgi:hypothetical protein
VWENTKTVDDVQNNRNASDDRLLISDILEDSGLKPARDGDVVTPHLEFA